MYIYIYITYNIYIYIERERDIHTYIHIYIYIYRERERVIRDGEEDMWGGRLPKHRVTGWRAVSVLGLQGKGKARMQELYEDLSTCSPTIMSENIYVDVIFLLNEEHMTRGVFN